MEEFKLLPYPYSNNKVSNEGNVLTTKDVYATITTDKKSGHLVVGVYNLSSRKMERKHVRELVILAFRKTYKPEKHDIGFKNGDVTDCSLNNLKLIKK